MTELESLTEIEERYWSSAKIEGEDYKHLSMRNGDIEFLIDLSKRALETKKQENI